MTTVMNMHAGQEMGVDLCQLFGTMKLEGNTLRNPGDLDSSQVAVPSFDHQTSEDVRMLDVRNLGQGQAHSSSGSISRSAPTLEPAEGEGCAFLRAIRARMDTYPTTEGAYMDTIFAHREVYAVYPSWHGRRICAEGFYELARALEFRPGRSDRHADMEAAVAFRYEALLIETCS